MSGRTRRARWRDEERPATITGSVAALTNGVSYAMRIDEYGNFTFDIVMPGIYQLEVTLGDGRITIECPDRDTSYNKIYEYFSLVRLLGERQETAMVRAFPNTPAWCAVS